LFNSLEANSKHLRRRREDTEFAHDERCAAKVGHPMRWGRVALTANSCARRHLTFFREALIMVCVREIESRKEHHDRAPFTPRPIHVFAWQRTGFARAVPSRRSLLGRPVSSVRREGIWLSRLFYFLHPVCVACARKEAPRRAPTRQL